MVVTGNMVQVCGFLRVSERKTQRHLRKDITFAATEIPQPRWTEVLSFVQGISNFSHIYT